MASYSFNRESAAKAIAITFANRLTCRMCEDIKRLTYYDVKLRNLK